MAAQKKLHTKEQMRGLQPGGGGEKNPTGKNNPALSRFRKWSQTELEDAISILLRNTDDENRRILKNPKETTFRKNLASLLFIAREDEKKMNLLLDRSVGPVTRDVRVLASGEKSPHEDMSEEDQQAFSERVMKNFAITKGE